MMITKRKFAKKEVTKMSVLKIAVGDKLQMKKPHPCGEHTMEVLRIGSDLRIRCIKCGRDVTVARVKLEKNIKKVISKEEKEETV
jgi:hypothetical protein